MTGSEFHRRNRWTAAGDSDFCSSFLELSSILSSLQCDLSVIEDRLGTSAGITDDNIVLHLGVVEQKINELLTIQAFLSSKVSFVNFCLLNNQISWS